MWQGNMANVLQVGPESAFLFLANDMLTSIVRKDKKTPLTLPQKFMCGAGAGILSMTAVYPMYVVQNRLMVAKEGLYTSIFDCIRKTYRAEGIRAFSQGYVPSFVRIIPYKGIDLAGYHILREQFVTPGEMPSKFQSLSFGAIAACVSQTVTHPLLLARTKLQCQGDAMGRPIKYKNMADAVHKTFMKGYRNGNVFKGFVSLWAGWVPSMAKNVPAIAIQFCVYEECLKFVDGMRS